MRILHYQFILVISAKEIFNNEFFKLLRLVKYRLFESACNASLILQEMHLYPELVSSDNKYIIVRPATIL